MFFGLRFRQTKQTAWNLFEKNSNEKCAEKRKWEKSKKQSAANGIQIAIQ